MRRIFLVLAVIVGVASLPDQALACYECDAQGASSGCEGAILYGAASCGVVEVEWGYLCDLGGGVVECGSRTMGAGGQVVATFGSEDSSLDISGGVHRNCDWALVAATADPDLDLSHIVV